MWNGLSGPIILSDCGIYQSNAAHRLASKSIFKTRNINIYKSPIILVGSGIKEHPSLKHYLFYKYFETLFCGPNICIGPSCIRIELQCIGLQSCWCCPLFYLFIIFFFLYLHLSFDLIHFTQCWPFLLISPTKFKRNYDSLLDEKKTLIQPILNNYICVRVITHNSYEIYNKSH